MCGIAGFIDASAHRRETIERMIEKIYHRGPDAGDTWLDEHSGMTFGFRRLAIRDVSSNGMQPMHSQDGRYVIVFNGEIYNASEVLAQMETEGFRDIYRGTSDTEILLNAFCHYGVMETLKMIRGMFGIALYDRKEKILYLMRDRYGEKPLFYGRIKGHFVFASELSAIREFPGFEGTVRHDAVGLYMKNNGYIPAPDTIYKDIYKLFPGEVLTLRLEDGKENKQWYYNVTENILRATENKFVGSFEDAVDELESILYKVIEKQMVSDVPLGAYLSGGTDSATVVAIMSKIAKRKVKTFSIGFDDINYDEAKDAKRIAEHLGTEHYEQYVTEKDLKDVIPKIPFIYGEPFADSSQIPTYLVSKLAKKHVTVSLSGDAGDELFCGYTFYPYLKNLWNKIQPIPFPVRKMGGSLLCNMFSGGRWHRIGLCLQSENILKLRENVDNRDFLLDRLVTYEKKDKKRLLSDDFTELQLLDMENYHPNDILVKVDRAGMAVSLENRIPFLDPSVVEFAFSLPLEYKYDGTIAKKVLKEVLYRHVPREIMERPKRGFSVPLHKWLKEGDTADWAGELMNNCKMAQDGYLDKKRVEMLWKRFQDNPTSALIIWNVLMLEQWYRNIGISH